MEPPPLPPKPSQVATEVSFSPALPPRINPLYTPITSGSSSPQSYSPPPIPQRLGQPTAQFNPHFDTNTQYPPSPPPPIHNLKNNLYPPQYPPNPNYDVNNNNDIHNIPSQSNSTITYDINNNNNDQIRDNTNVLQGYPPQNQYQHQNQYPNQNTAWNETLETVHPSSTSTNSHYCKIDANIGELLYSLENVSCTLLDHGKPSGEPIFTTLTVFRIPDDYLDLDEKKKNDKRVRLVNGFLQAGEILGINLNYSLPTFSPAENTYLFKMNANFWLLVLPQRESKEVQTKMRTDFEAVLSKITTFQTRRTGAQNSVISSITHQINMVGRDIHTRLGIDPNTDEQGEEVDKFEDQRLKLDEKALKKKEKEAEKKEKLGQPDKVLVDLKLSSGAAVEETWEERIQRLKQEKIQAKEQKLKELEEKKEAERRKKEERKNETKEEKAARLQKEKEERKEEKERKEAERKEGKTKKKDFDEELQLREKEINKDREREKKEKTEKKKAAKKNLPATNDARDLLLTTIEHQVIDKKKSEKILEKSRTSIEEMQSDLKKAQGFAHALVNTGFFKQEDGDNNTQVKENKETAFNLTRAIQSVAGALGGAATVLATDVSRRISTDPRGSNEKLEVASNYVHAGINMGLAMAYNIAKHRIPILKIGLMASPILERFVDTPSELETAPKSPFFGAPWKMGWMLFCTLALDEFQMAWVVMKNYSIAWYTSPEKVTHFF
eukprot:TRINITY_DN3601_c0_g2_i1.p1 TRINITY_DN3601_c0_g2~~TRINITY_DN3601_c0_g2_i1.p1  ORF type:complete len:723 (-),score=227.68 TRINITY_DN3601_c0_g2_i1:177-2345(-)